MSNSNKDNGVSTIINGFGKFATSSAAVLSGGVALVGAFGPQAAIVVPSFLALGATCLGFLKLNNQYLDEQKNGTLRNKGFAKRFLLTGANAVCSAFGIAGLGLGAASVASVGVDVAQIPNIGNTAISLASQVAIGWILGNTAYNLIVEQRIIPDIVHDIASSAKKSILGKIDQIRGDSSTKNDGSFQRPSPK